MRVMSLGVLHISMMMLTCANKEKRVRGDQLPWITPEIKLEISRRNRMFKQHVKNHKKARR